MLDQANEASADTTIDYVTRATWATEVGRADHIDDVADQFERPPAKYTIAMGAWHADHAARWPRASRGWRSADRLQARTAELEIADQEVAHREAVAS